MDQSLSLGAQYVEEVLRCEKKKRTHPAPLQLQGDMYLPPLPTSPGQLNRIPPPDHHPSHTDKRRDTGPFPPCFFPSICCRQPSGAANAVNHLPLRAYLPTYASRHPALTVAPPLSPLPPEHDAPSRPQKHPSSLVPPPSASGHFSRR